MNDELQEILNTLNRKLGIPVEGERLIDPLLPIDLQEFYRTCNNDEYDLMKAIIDEDSNKIIEAFKNIDGVSEEALFKIIKQLSKSSNASLKVLFVRSINQFFEINPFYSNRRLSYDVATESLVLNQSSKTGHRFTKPIVLSDGTTLTMESW